MTFKQISRTEWQWQSTTKQHAVRLFDQQETLIWSTWVDRPDGPQYEDGVRQMLADFQANGPPTGIDPPTELLNDLRAQVAPRAERRGGFFAWLRGS